MSTSSNFTETDFKNKILVAGSQEDVKSLIDYTLKKMMQNKVSAEDINQFIDSNIHQLENLNPLNKNERQWSNINMARIHLQHIKRNAGVTVVTK